MTINFPNHDRIEGKDEWLTPPELIKELGPFDLDPCSPSNSPFFIAPSIFTKDDDGLSKDWFGKVFVNPPYGKEIIKWLTKLSDYGNGIALIFARTDTKAFHEYVFNKADAILFLKGRLNFYNIDGTPGKSGAGAPSCLVAYGKDSVDTLSKVKHLGKLVLLKHG